MSVTEQRCWRVTASRLEFEDANVAVVSEQVSTPSRAKPHPWTTVRRKPAVAIAPLTAQRKLVLIRQERIPIRATIWECPAGQIDELCDAGSFKAVALRELKEETGYELASDGQITLLGDFFSSPGFTDEHAFLVLASPVKPSVDGPQHQPSESIVECREFSFSQVRQLIARNEIRDANTLAIFARLTACELIPNE